MSYPPDPLRIITKPEGKMSGQGNGERDNALWVKRAKEYGFLREDEPLMPQWADPMPRVFDTGATRDTEKGKLDYEAFLSPLVLERFAQYMDKHRVQSDGTLRPGDNWQKGIPDDAYMKSLFRHFMEVWKAHRAGDEMEEALCAVMFNAMGLLYEIVRLR